MGLNSVWYWSHYLQRLFETLCVKLNKYIVKYNDTIFTLWSMLVVWVGLKWLVLCEVLNSTNGQYYQYHTLNYEERMLKYIPGSRTHSTTQSPPMQTFAWHSFPGWCVYTVNHNMMYISAVSYRNAWRLSGRLAPVRWPSGTTARLRVPGSSAQTTHVISVHCPSRRVRYMQTFLHLFSDVFNIQNHSDITRKYDNKLRVMSSGIQRRVVCWNSRKINRAKNAACCK